MNKEVAITSNEFARSGRLGKSRKLASARPSHMHDMPKSMPCFSC